MPEKVRQGDIWRNLKTQALYEVLHTALDSEEPGTVRVVYRQPGRVGLPWVRPLDLFLEKFERVRSLCP